MHARACVTHQISSGAAAADLGGALFDPSASVLAGLPAYGQAVDASMGAPGSLAAAVMTNVWREGDPAAPPNTPDERLRDAALVITSPQLEAYKVFLARRAGER